MVSFLKSLPCFFLLSIKLIIAENTFVVSGTISDKLSREPIAFATVSIKNKTQGTLSNESGSFELRLGETFKKDTLVISSLGYKSFSIPIDKLKEPLLISMEASSVELKEVIVLALPAVEYIRRAVRNIKTNYPNKPFETEEYYREQIKEQGAMLSRAEAIFKTYHPQYLDTVSNQHQLLLYQKDTNVTKLQFMKAEFAKKREKKKKKLEKKGKVISKEESNEIISFIGGPDMILKSDVIKSKVAFLDSTKFKKFIYRFGGQTSMHDKNLLIINFESDGKVEHMRSNGKIYIDIDSYAIVLVDYAGEYIVPTLAKPLLLVMYGIGIENPKIEQKVAYFPIKNKWYPRDFYFSGGSTVTKKRLFKSNEQSSFLIEQVLTVNNIITENPKPISFQEKFNVKKKMKDQVLKDSTISWADRNVIKR